MGPLDTLFAEHRRHYDPGTLERFEAWFARSGHSEMLKNPFLRGGAGKNLRLTNDAIPFAELQGLSFRNDSTAPWPVAFTPTLDRGANTVETLFSSFVRCTGHTHLLGDFRCHLGYFVKAYAGSRYIVFDGAGTCLLLGAMFQALASRVLDEKIDLHYSHSAKRELTHVFASWRGEYFVDPDQKTYVPLAEIDQSAIFGYLFQQLGVSAHQVYRALDEDTRDFLFARMTREYFSFYAHSVAQYMYEPHQEVGKLSDYFAEARTGFCSPLSVDVSDFLWKDELRRQAALQGIEKPYFLIRSGEPIPLEIPPSGRFDIGLDPQALPEEAALLATLFLGRVPAALRVPLNAGRADVVLPEFPWLIVLAAPSAAIAINGRPMAVRPSRCGRFGIIGMGEFEAVFDLAGGHDNYALFIDAPDLQTITIVLPFNAFALTAGLIRIDAPAAPGRILSGRGAA